MWTKTADTMPNEDGYYITVYYYAITDTYIKCLDRYSTKQNSFIDHFGSKVNNRLAWIKIPDFTNS